MSLSGTAFRHGQIVASRFSLGEKVPQDQAHDAEQVQQDQAQDTEQAQQIVPYQANQNVAEANYDDPDVIASLQAAYAAGLVSAEELDFYQAGGI